jgi:hypothetical protein
MSKGVQLGFHKITTKPALLFGFKMSEPGKKK